MGPEAAVNAIHFNRVMAIEDLEERAAFVDAERAKYEADIDVFQLANENAFEVVVPGDQLRRELVDRFRVYSRKPKVRAARRNGIAPV
jgi:acetyl-CoA carboxylase carboxyltransferase component